MGPKPASNTIPFIDAKNVENFPLSAEKGGKNELGKDVGGCPETLQNTAISADPAPSTGGNSWGKVEGAEGGKPSPAKKAKKSIVKKSPKSHTPALTPTPGPAGYLDDCEKLKKEGDLQAAYPSEYLSFKKRKEYATTKPGWYWAKEWTKFRDFLRDMGPKPTPHHELDRKVSANKAYGPGLCHWADHTTQNNNKSDNVRIVVPLTGEVFTVKKIATVHKVQPTTVYGWLDKGYTVLELLAGKRLPHLSAFITKLAELPPVAPKGTKTPLRKIDASKIRKPGDDTRWGEIDKDLWDECELDCGGDTTTGKKLFATLMAQRAQEYANLVEWVGRYNAGLPCSPHPPAG